jgi:hypothetical protein
MGSQAMTSRTDITRQRRRIYAIAATSVLCGVSFTVAPILAIASYQAVDASAVSLLIGAAFALLAGSIFGSYFVSAIGRLTHYIQGSEDLIIHMGDKIQDLNVKNTTLALRASMKDAQIAGESEDERWNDGCSSSDVIPLKH